MGNLKNSTILYIEDDEITRENISSYLKRQCKTLIVAQDGQDGLEKFQEFGADVVITDIEMPNMNGLLMAKKIRKLSSNTQIIITTAYTDQEYLLVAVNLKLVQYLVKPISLPKLANALKESEEFLEDSNDTRKYFHKNTFYDIYTKELISNDEIISLSKHERALLELLLKNSPAPSSYESIESQVYEFSTSKNAIKLLVKSLRNKLDKEVISNVPGLGYNINIME